MLTRFMYRKFSPNDIVTKCALQDWWSSWMLVYCFCKIFTWSSPISACSCQWKNYLGRAVDQNITRICFFFWSKSAFSPCIPFSMTLKASAFIPMWSPNTNKRWQLFHVGEGKWIDLHRSRLSEIVCGVLLSEGGN